MKRRGPITVQSVRFNRNGLSGDSFFVIAFTLHGTPLIGVLFPDGDGPWSKGRDFHGEPQLAEGMERCAIVDPANPRNMHTYEGMGGWLAEAIDKWVADGRAFLSDDKEVA